MDAALNPAPGAPPSRPPILAVAMPAAGLVFVAIALSDLASHARLTISSAELWTMSALGTGGIVVFFLSLLFRVGGRQRELAAVAEGLSREYHALEEQTHSLEAAKRDVEAVLDSVPSRLLLIDGTYRIAGSYSSELESIFSHREEDEGNFLNVLRRLLPEAKFKAARDYLATLFESGGDERALADRNPLREVEVTASASDGAIALRSLDFHFRRIVENGAVERVLVSVEDATDRFERDRQLREGDQRKVKQFDLLLGIMHVEPRALERFVQTAREQLSGIDEALRASDFASAAGNRVALLRQRLDTVLRRVRDIKDSATLLRLAHFERRALDYERHVLDLKSRTAPLGGDDFLSLIIAQAEFRSELEELACLRVRLAGLRRAARVHEEIGDDLTISVSQVAAELAASQGKEIVIETDGFDTRSLPAERRLVVKDVLLELTRNAVVHGIEDPATREAAGKPRAGTISISQADAAPGHFAFAFRDDGRGLDPARIKERAIAAGLIDSERASMLDDSEVAGFIFSPEFTTAANTGFETFRGMGLAVVKQRVVDECGGTITIDAESGTFCEFTFALPGVRAEVF